MEVNCQAWHERVRIIATDGWLAEYNGQECDAIFYDGLSPHIDTEQLTPPKPRYQTAKASDLEVLTVPSHYLTALLKLEGSEG